MPLLVGLWLYLFPKYYAPSTLSYNFSKNFFSESHDASRNMSSNQTSLQEPNGVLKKSSFMSILQ